MVAVSRLVKTFPWYSIRRRQKKVHRRGFLPVSRGKAAKSRLFQQWVALVQNKFLTGRQSALPICQPLQNFMRPCRRYGDSSVAELCSYAQSPFVCRRTADQHLLSFVCHTRLLVAAIETSLGPALKGWKKRRLPRNVRQSANLPCWCSLHQHFDAVWRQNCFCRFCRQILRPIPTQ